MANNNNQGNTNGKVQSDPLKPKASELCEEVQKVRNDLVTSQQGVRSATTNEEREQHGARVDMRLDDVCKTEKEYRNVREKDDEMVKQ